MAERKVLRDIFTKKILDIHIPRYDKYLDLIFPIGRGFIDFTNTDYSNYLGFTWERELVNLTPIGCDAKGSNIGTTKGSETHMHYGPTISGTSSSGLAVGISNSYQTHKSLEKNDRFYGALDDLKGVELTEASAYGTDTESSYQPSKVVAYWKRVA